MVRVASMKALAEGKPFDEILAQGSCCRPVRLSRQEIHDLLNPDRHTGTAQQVERLYENLKRNYLNG